MQKAVINGSLELPYIDYITDLLRNTPYNFKLYLQNS